MKIAETGLIHGDPECQYKHFTAKVGSPIDPDAPIDEIGRASWRATGLITVGGGS